MTVPTLVVADDRSGACDTGHQFAARGCDTVVVSHRDAADGDVLVVDTDSRYLDAATAADRVREAIETHAPARTYKKVDSTLRGNLVAEVDAAIEATAADVAVVAPAFPAEGRTTVGGYHLVDGTPVTETAAGADPDAPVRTSHLPTRFADSTFDVAHIPVDAVGDAATVADRLRDATETDGPTVVTVDAATDDHLAAIASGSDASSLDVVSVGSAGLARHVPLGEHRRSVLGVVGSANPGTFEQLDALPDESVVDVDGGALVTDRERAVSSAVERAVATVEDRDSVVLTAARSPADVEATLTTAEEAGLSRSTARERVAGGLATVAARSADATGPGGYFLSGGAIATATLAALDADSVRLTGITVEDGIPVGRLVGGVAANRPVVTKAGAFGDRKTIRNCLDSLANYDE